ncbi:MAG TPA: carbamoyltransferase HypF [Acidobacteriota bacterium]|nr:carbamoyltransferase HypF [Acidobacteriota bacterium]
MVRMAPAEGCLSKVIQRMHIVIRGAVQGVGFRPFVYRLATELKLPGWVLNSPQGVFIEVEGEKQDLDSFLFRLQNEKPAPSFIQSLEFSLLDPIHFGKFVIRESERAGAKSALILPDIATCPECLREIFDPENRRHRYPFTNCTHCGPRFSIIESLPYDRPNTSMKSFEMCADCRAEYEDPQNRRFHAQPNACPACGPELELWDPAGKVLSRRDDALLAAVDAVRTGKIVAIKGLGGFHLVADARSARSVENLRLRKHREEKPFALMCSSLDQIRQICAVSDLEARLLTSPESPIVLLRRADGYGSPSIAENLAPHNPYLGVMLPYTPLHHLFMKEIQFPIIATSGNLSDEPICTDEREALARLAGIADLFLVHNRPIVRHVDDSILRVILGRELVLRRARGYAPLPVHCRRLLPDSLAVGAHLKNTIALTVGDNVFVSQHIGDLENKEAFDAFEDVIRSFRHLYRVDPVRIVADLHPDYLSTKYARESRIPVLSVQHHYAHVAACMAENELDGRVLGVCWDGTGFGTDGTVWGGEFLLTSESDFRRVASFRRFMLPGSASAVKEPRRAAMGVLYEILGNRTFELKNFVGLRSFSEREIAVLAQMLQKGIQSPWTSSAGRLFDAVASLSGLRQVMSFEGQAAMELEFAIGSEKTDEFYPIVVTDKVGGTGEDLESRLIVDWEQMIVSILEDAKNEIPLARISIKFHNTLVEAVAKVAHRVSERRVILTGGCFQNKYLLEHAVRRLEADGFRPYWHQRIPPNDGGIALGQIVAASRMVPPGNAAVSASGRS